jgi:hypothetical protein
MIGGAMIGGDALKVAKQISSIAKPHIRKSGKAGKAVADVLDAVGLGVGADALKVAKQISKIAKPHIRKSGKAGKAVADVLDAVGMGRGRDRQPRRQNAELNTRRRRAMKMARDLREAGYDRSTALREAWKRV